MLRYGRNSAQLPAHLLQFSQDKKPVVVWNITRKCNLSCLHCYASAVLPQDMPAPMPPSTLPSTLPPTLPTLPTLATQPMSGQPMSGQPMSGGNMGNMAAMDDMGEVSTAKARLIIEDLAEYGVPVLLFSGGEPLLRDDLPELAAYAVQKGMRAVVSSNGTLISKEKATQLKKAGLSYVGISLDGNEHDHNRLRQCQQAYEGAMRGIANCKAAGLKVGLRFTLTSNNWRQVPDMFNLLRSMDIARICFYHLVSSGRGRGMAEQALSHKQTRQVLDLIMQQTQTFFEQGQIKEVLTVDNHADGPYLWMKLAQINPERAKQVYKLLEYNGGNSSGLGLACISWNGDVLPDQFWPKQELVNLETCNSKLIEPAGNAQGQFNFSLGNIHTRAFSQIWQDSSLNLLAKLRNKKHYVQGRCAQCRFLDVCGGNFRARAFALTGNLWASDPACYLTDDEIFGPKPYATSMLPG